MLPADCNTCIFDLDGTLLDTEPLYSQAAQKVLDPYGHTYTMELKRRVMGGDSTRSAQLTIDEFDLPMSAAGFLAAREAFLEELFPAAEEIEGAGSYLYQLHNAGISLGLATSSHTHLCELKIGHRDWRQLFAAIVCGNDPEISRGKPDPQIFQVCATRLGVDPARTVAFEDSRNGILAARAAGMFVVAVRSPYTTEADLADADLQIENFRELLKS
ncbi:MAG: HAD-IA family hydrolase [Proteobacteria bacterium]|nr:HAD-IA family hydrolase [Pseudomonadota bacterium]